MADAEVLQVAAIHARGLRGDHHFASSSLTWARHAAIDAEFRVDIDIVAVQAVKLLLRACAGSKDTTKESARDTVSDARHGGRRRHRP